MMCEDSVGTSTSRVFLFCSTPSPHRRLSYFWLSRFNPRACYFLQTVFCIATRHPITNKIILEYLKEKKQSFYIMVLFYRTHHMILRYLLPIKHVYLFSPDQDRNSLWILSAFTPRMFLERIVCEG